VDETTLADVVGGLPITQGQAYGLLRYDESRHVENLALQNPQAMRAALDEGKINAEVFQRSVVLTDSDHLRHKAAEIAASLNACEQLQSTADRLFGQDAPSFAGLHDVLSRAGQLAEKLLKDRGIDLHPAPVAPTPVVGDSAGAQSEGAAMTQTQQDIPVTPLRTTPQTRDEAFTLLAGIAQYFKQTEPHEPCPLPDRTRDQMGQHAAGGLAERCDQGQQCGGQHPRCAGDEVLMTGRKNCRQKKSRAADGRPGLKNA